MRKQKQIELLKSELLIIKSDLFKVIKKLDQMDQSIINLNHKVNQHIKEGHIPRETDSNPGNRILFTASDDSRGGTVGNN